jgi:hypothetical protein
MTALHRQADRNAPSTRRTPSDITAIGFQAESPFPRLLVQEPHDSVFPCLGLETVAMVCSAMTTRTPRKSGELRASAVSLFVIRSFLKKAQTKSWRV